MVDPGRVGKGAEPLEVPFRRHHFAGAGRHLDGGVEGYRFTYGYVGSVTPLNREIHDRLYPSSLGRPGRDVDLRVHDVVGGARRLLALLDPRAQVAQPLLQGPAVADGMSVGLDGGRIVVLGMVDEPLVAAATGPTSSGRCG